MGNEDSDKIPLLDTLAEHFSADLWGFSAIDRYLGRDTLPFVFVETGAGLSDLARLFEDLRFPGFYPADAAVERDGRVYYLRCLDTEESSPRDCRRPGFALLDLRQDWRNRRFRDPRGIYPLLRLILKNGPFYRREEDQSPRWDDLNPETGRYRALVDGALILARYSPSGEEPLRLIKETAALFNTRLPGDPPPCRKEQRLLLTGLLVSPRPDLGLELLKAGGFLEEFWPELAALDGVDHSKEFHPEGNVWKHTLETFRYRKPARIGGYAPAAFDFRLSLGLLLHDVGKASAESSGNHRFAGHAELGARQARRFLEDLGFEAPLIEDIFYLVRNHMLPAALPRLPLARTEEIMASPLFPTLMELYRCDESSSFKGLDGYYESSAAYQSYLRYRRNPYRSADGKKMRMTAKRYK